MVISAMGKNKSRQAELEICDLSASEIEWPLRKKHCTNYLTM